VVADGEGRVLAPARRFKRGLRMFYYRELEAGNADPVQGRDPASGPALVVVDKPHFLPVIPPAVSCTRLWCA
jgi:tRNA pseudouridine32 synthase/23S rRNA pseudouridine746 synthase